MFTYLSHRSLLRSCFSHASYIETCEVHVFMYRSQRNHQVQAKMKPAKFTCRSQRLLSLCVHVMTVTKFMCSHTGHKEACQSVTHRGCVDTLRGWHHVDCTPLWLSHKEQCPSQEVGIFTYLSVIIFISLLNLFMLQAFFNLLSVLNKQY